MPWIEKKSPDGKTTQRFFQPDPIVAPKATPLQTMGKDAFTQQNVARNEAAQSKTTGVLPKPPETSYNPQEALQNRAKAGETAPVSPYVGTSKLPTPEAPTPGAPSGTQAGAPAGTPSGTPAPITNGSAMEQATNELTPGVNQREKDYKILFDIAQQGKDEKVDAVTQLYDRQVASLNELQGMMEKLTAQKNSLIQGSSDVQRAEVQAAYDANAAQLKIAQDRLDETQRKVLSEREKQLERKKVNEENMLAVIGGFGSMAGNKYLLDSIDAGNEAMGALKTEFSLQDREMTQKVVDLNNTYKTDNMKIEQWKSEQIGKNFENLQNYIATIIKDKNMADSEKVDAINTAKDQYNSTISKLHKDVIDARFELSRDIIARADQLTKEADAKAKSDLQTKRGEIEDVRADLSLLAQNYAMEDYSKLPVEVTTKIADLEVKAGLPNGFVQQAIKNLKETTKASDVQIMNNTNANGDWTIVAIDKKTGKVMNQTSILKGGKPMASSVKTTSYMESNGNKLSKQVFTAGRLINEPMGTATVAGTQIKAKASVIKKVETANNAMKAAGKGELKIRGSFRTNDEQSAIPSENTNADAGESFHEAGQAIDVDNWQDAEPFLRAQGMVNDLAWDKGHFSIGETNKINEKVDEFAQIEAPKTETPTAPNPSGSAGASANLATEEDPFADLAP